MAWIREKILFHRKRDPATSPAKVFRLAAPVRSPVKVGSMYSLYPERCIDERRTIRNLVLSNCGYVAKEKRESELTIRRFFRARTSANYAWKVTNELF